MPHEAICTSLSLPKIRLSELVVSLGPSNQLIVRYSTYVFKDTVSQSHGDRWEVQRDYLRRVVEVNRSTMKSLRHIVDAVWKRDMTCWRLMVSPRSLCERL